MYTRNLMLQHIYFRYVKIKITQGLIVTCIYWQSSEKRFYPLRFKSVSINHTVVYQDMSKVLFEFSVLVFSAQGCCHDGLGIHVASNIITTIVFEIDKLTYSLNLCEIQYTLEKAVLIRPSDMHFVLCLNFLYF